MPYFLSDFMREHEEIELMLDVTNKQKVTESLERNELDFALVSVLPENVLVEKLELMKNKLFLVANTDKKFSKTPYTRALLNELPLIFREPGSSTRTVMEKFLPQSAPVKKKLELTSNEAVKQAVLAGLGCSIMPLIGIRNELNNGSLQIIPVKGLPIQSSWHLVWMKGKNFSPVASAFLSYIKKERQKVIKQHFNWYEKY
jgi:DNA-binding transcriptional LysR family regulator